MKIAPATALARIRDILGPRYSEMIAAALQVSDGTVRYWYRTGRVSETLNAVRLARFAIEKGLVERDELGLVRELGGEALSDRPRPGAGAKRSLHSPHCWKKRGFGKLTALPRRGVEAVHYCGIPVREVPRVLERQLRVGMIQRPGDVPERRVPA